MNKWIVSILFVSCFVFVGIGVSMSLAKKTSPPVPETPKNSVPVPGAPQPPPQPPQPRWQAIPDETGHIVAEVQDSPEGKVVFHDDPKTCFKVMYRLHMNFVHMLQNQEQQNRMQQEAEANAKLKAATKKEK